MTAGVKRGPASAAHRSSRRHWLGLLAGLPALARSQAAPPTRALAGETIARYHQPGASTVTVIDEIWTDRARGRELPLRLRLPEGESPVAVVLFSHGLGGSRRGGAEWGAHWASHGIAVIHLQHPGSDETLWRGRQGVDRVAALRTGMNAEQFIARVQDVRFVLDELARRQAQADARLRRLDLTRAGLSGHSFGARTTMSMAGQRFPPAIQRQVDAGWGDLTDPRLKAFVAFSPQGAGEDLPFQVAPMTLPCLMITGTRDGQPRPGIGVPPEQRVLPFEAMSARGNKYLAVFEDGDHMIFNGLPGLSDLAPPGTTRPGVAELEARIYPGVKAGSTAFWLAYLNQDTAARRWLDEGGYAAFVGERGRIARK